MGDINQVSLTAINPLITGETKKRGGLDFRVYQELKTGIHRDLLNKVDLEKVATVRDDRTRRQVFGVIQDLVSNLKTPLSGPESDSRWRFSKNCSAWGRWSRCFRTRRSATFS